MRSNRTCGGYTSLESTNVVDTIKAYNIPFKVPGSRLDRQLLHFYCVEAALSLSSFSDADFWSRLVLQRCHHQPVIRNALVTLSAIYRDYKFKDDARPESDRPALQHLQLIARSHKQLRIHLCSPDASIEVALICSVVFYTFEALLGNAVQAIRHLDQGLILLKRSQATAPVQNATDAILPRLTVLFASLDIQASTYNPNRRPILSLISPLEQSRLVPLILDSSSSTLADAQMALTKLQNWMLHHLASSYPYKKKGLQLLPSDILLERHHLYDQLTRYIKTVSAYSTHLSGPSTANCLLLRLQARMFRTIVAEDVPSLQFTDSDSLRKCLQDISAVLESMLGYSSTQGTPAQRSFTLSTQLVAALYYICMKSNHPSIVDMALSLLRHKRLPHRDGVWDARTVEAVVHGIRRSSKLPEWRIGGQEATDYRLEYANEDLINAVGEGGLYEIREMLRRHEQYIMCGDSPSLVSGLI
ncbi:Zn(II)2Cys6 transcription factor [Aspergillus luchuensis]|nr:Zn(II)2Cys6 transcription factor [Aspergillus luchuensis IFO 4308]GAT31228.1 Zn(II)2Cys6 transcription factor [Aspergillus luchuensis]